MAENGRKQLPLRQPPLLITSKSPSEGEHPAAEATSRYFNGLVNSRDLQEVIETQISVLNRFEKTNETLGRANALCEVRLEVMSKEFKNHTSTLMEMKRNLETIFKRIRVLKRTIKAKYPEAYAACEVTYTPPDDEEEEQGTSAGTTPT